MGETSQRPKTEEPVINIPPELQGKTLIRVPAMGSSGESSEPVQQAVRTAEPLSEESRDSFSTLVHEYLREQITMADQKAAFVITVVSTVLAYLHANGVTKQWMIPVKEWGFFDGLALVAVVALMLGAVGCFVVVAPRLRGSASGLIFFRGISVFEKATQYSTAVLSRSSAELASEKLAHCHELALTAKKKYKAVSFAVYASIIGLAAALTLIGFGPDAKSATSTKNTPVAASPSQSPQP